MNTEGNYFRCLLFCFNWQRSPPSPSFLHLICVSPERGHHRGENQVWNGERLHRQLDEEKNLRRLQRGPRVGGQTPSTGEEVEQKAVYLQAALITACSYTAVFTAAAHCLVVAFFLCGRVFCHILHRER